MVTPLKIEGSGGILPPKEAGKDACTTFSSFVVFARTWGLIRSNRLSAHASFKMPL